MPIYFTPMRDFMFKNIDKLQLFDDFDFINSELSDETKTKF
jgi:hypothetical protein